MSDNTSAVAPAVQAIIDRWSQAATMTERDVYDLICEIERLSAVCSKLEVCDE